MTELTTNFAADQSLTLLTGYGFELKGYPASILLYKWLNHYRANWIRLAVIEALYLGRYKAISVEHILDGWLRRGQPNFHFSHEFERLICENLTQKTNFRANSRAKMPPLKLTPVTSPSEPASLTTEAPARPELKPAAAPATLPPVEGKETGNRRTIEQFTPLLDNSELYGKLRAVAHRELDSQQPLAASGQE